MASISQIKVGSTTYDIKAEFLKGLGRKTSVATIALNPSIDTGFNVTWHISDSTARTNDATNSPSFDAGIINVPWDWGGYNGQIAIQNTVAGNTRMQIRSASHIDNGDGANPRYTPNYGAWREVVTATKATTVGGTDRPVYISDTGQATQTTYRMAATNAAATTAVAITDNLNTGIWYVNGTNSTDLYSQSDGVAFVNKYNDNWISEIYQDYRTGQIALRGKNNGTWQSWRKVLDSSNYSSWALPLTGGTVTGTLILSRTTDAAGSTDNKPALIIGGASTAQHIEIDGNEILSKSNGTTPGTLYLQDGTGSVSVAGSGGLTTVSGGAGFKCRNISFGTSAPSGGANGDVYIQYS